MQSCRIQTKLIAETETKFMHGRKNVTYSVAKVVVELLDDKSETARDLVKHSVAEYPVRFPRDLPLCLPYRHLQPEKRIEIIRMPQNCSKSCHFHSVLRSKMVIQSHQNQKAISQCVLSISYNSAIFLHEFSVATRVM